MTSVCIYGSVARKDRDTLSDKDVLILFDGTEKCTRLKRQWEEDGWSVSSYTPNRLRSMSNSGSLFLQHLKQEGLIIEDSQGTLHDILSVYEPYPDYSQQIAESLTSLRLLERLPMSHELDYWSADVLHVLLRNLGILRLANEGIYEFSFEKIAKRLQEHQLISVEDLSVFSDLRTAKSEYRRGYLPNRPVKEVVEGALRVLEKLFGFSLERSNSLDFEAPDYVQPYFNLRAIEKVLIAYKGLPKSHLSCLSFEEQKLWKRVRDPRAYSWEVRTRTGDLWQLLLNSICDAPQTYQISGNHEGLRANTMGRHLQGAY